MRYNVLTMIKGRARPARPQPGRTGCSGKREGGTLVVDCQGCRQAQNLVDQHCLKGVLRLIAADPPNIREIVLVRDWHICYGREVVDILSKVADVVRFCNGLQFDRPFDDCAACSSNPRLVVSRVVDFLPRAAPELDTRNPRPSGGHGRACEQCVHNLRTNLDHARLMLDGAEASMRKTSVRVVSPDDH